MKVKTCVGCGFCCLKAICEVGARLYGPGVTQCPALEWKESRYVCKLMELPGDQGLAYRLELYAGEGCCAGLNTWRQDVKDRTSEIKTEIYHLDPVFQTFLHCLGREFVSGDLMYLVLSSMAYKLENEGWTKESALKVCNNIMMLFKQNRSKMVEGFMA